MENILTYKDPYFTNSVILSLQLVVVNGAIQTKQFWNPSISQYCIQSSSNYTRPSFIQHTDMLKISQSLGNFRHKLSLLTSRPSPLSQAVSKELPRKQSDQINHTTQSSCRSSRKPKTMLSTQISKKEQAPFVELTQQDIITQIEAIKSRKKQSQMQNKYKPVIKMHSELLREYDEACLKCSETLQTISKLEQEIRQSKQREMMVEEDKYANEMEKLQLIVEKQDLEHIIQLYRQQYPQEFDISGQLKNLQKQIQEARLQKEKTEKKIAEHDMRCLEWQKKSNYSVQAEKYRQEINKLRLSLFDKEEQVSRTLKQQYGVKKIRQLISLFVESKCRENNLEISAEYFSEIWICEKYLVAEFRQYSLSQISAVLQTRMSQDRSVLASLQSYFQLMNKLQSTVKMHTTSLVNAQYGKYTKESEQLKLQAADLQQQLDRLGEIRIGLSGKLEGVLAEEMQLYLGKMEQSSHDSNNIYQLKKLSKTQQDRLEHMRQVKSKIQKLQSTIQGIKLKLQSADSLNQTKDLSSNVAQLKKILKEKRMQFDKANTKKKAIQNKLYNALSKHKEKENKIYNQALHSLYQRLGEVYARNSYERVQYANILKTKQENITENCGPIVIQENEGRSTFRSQVNNHTGRLRRHLLEDPMMTESLTLTSSLASTQRDMLNINTNRELIRQNSRSKLISSASCSVSMAGCSQRASGMILKSEMLPQAKRERLTLCTQASASVLPKTKLSEFLMSKIKPRK